MRGRLTIPVHQVLIGVAGSDQRSSDATRARMSAASSAASARERALAFFPKGVVEFLERDLKANFLGGLKEVRIVCSFSERALMA